MEDLSQFRWRRATGRGYAWRTLNVRKPTMSPKVIKDARVLTFATPTGNGVSESIAPQKINGVLLWRLAETKIDEEAILEFANAYGLLLDEMVAYPAGRGARPIYRADPLFIWEAEITQARTVINLLTAIAENDEKALGKVIRWDKGNTAVRFVPRGELIASPEIRPGTLALFALGDVIVPARIVIARAVNKQLRKHVVPQLLWSESEQKFGVYLVPQSLLGAIWAQFAEIQDQRKVIGRCEVCGTWFQRIRKDKRHCSDRCRVRAMRMRKEGKK